MKLAINETQHGYEIGWYDSAEGEFGLMLGPMEGKDDPETRAAVRAILAAIPDLEVQALTHLGAWVWETESQAQSALRVAKAAAASVSRPEPAWALQARAAGWRPPKGWKP